MHVNEAIKLRRSIKHYDPKHVMTKEEIHTLLSNAVLSPTAFNIQNWRFVVVTDKALRQKIREVSWGQAQVEESSILIVLVADLMAWNREEMCKRAALELKDGYYVNLEGRIQKAFKASYPPGESKEDWEIINNISQFLNKSLDIINKFDLETKLIKSNNLYA